MDSVIISQNFLLLKNGNFCEDILNRTAYIEKLIKIIEIIADKHRNYCFAIDGKWGIGKTYVLEALEQALNEVQSEETSGDKYFIFHYNCWEYDYYSEPSIAIISAMLHRIKEVESLGIVEEFTKSAWGKAKECVGKIAGEFSKNKIGINIVETIQDINKDAKERKESKYKFDELYAFRQTLDKAKKELEELAREKAILIIVDELDRCIPNYAIKVMERLHHLFDGIDNITVIMAVDKSQLEQSVQQIYGNSVDVDKYLKKFIDFSLILDNGEITKSFIDKYSNYLSYFPNDENHIIIFTELFEVMFSEIDIRTQEKIMAKAKLIHELIKDDLIYDTSLMFFEIVYLVLSYIMTDIGRLNQIFGDTLITKGNLYEDIDSMLGNKITQYLQKIARHCNTGAIHNFSGRNYIIISNDVLGKMYWIFYAMYHITSYDICGRIYMPIKNQPEKELKAAKKFVELADMMI